MVICKHVGLLYAHSGPTATAANLLEQLLSLKNTWTGVMRGTKGTGVSSYDMQACGVIARAQ